MAGSRWKLASAVLSAVLLSTWVGVANAAVVEGVDLTLRGQTSLPSLGHDGQTKARGQNGDVALMGDYAFVGGGSKNHGTLSTPGRICTDYGGVKVVDLSNPASPSVIDQIDIGDSKPILTGPKGNPRRNVTVQNVASTASSVDVFHNPVANKDILAITTERCEQSFFDGARILFYDVTDPENISASPIGIFDPETIVNPLCDPGPPITCPSGVSPADGRWGIIEDIRMFSRNNGPGGATKVYALVTTPFSIGNTGGVSFSGDFRILDVTNPAAPIQLATFPNSAIGQNSNNGCRVFQSARTASPTPDGSGALVTYYDGSQPPGPAGTDPFNGDPIRVEFGIDTTAAVFRLDLDNLPNPTGPGTGTDEAPKTFTPNPAAWGYPVGEDGGMTASGEEEGNAADVQAFVGANGHLYGIVSEEDIDPALTYITINAPASAAYNARACANLGAWSKLYQRPNQELTDDIAFVGRGCPASTLANSTLLQADPYLDDPNGKIAIFDGGGDGFNGCSLAKKAQRAAAAGAVAVINNIGGDLLNLSNAGPDGGMPDVPSIIIPSTGFNKMVNFVPNRVQTGATLPAANGWEVQPGSQASNAALKPLAAALGCTSGTPEACNAATNASPIAITAPNHGLSTGDRVAIAGVQGNTAANGNHTVTVTSTSAFTLDGSSGNGAYTGGGYVVQCAPNTPNCSAPALRTDISRLRSVANATDRVAGFRVKAANRFNVTGGQSYRAGAVIEVAEYTDGQYEAQVEWFDAANASLGTSTITNRTALTTRQPFSATVTAPAAATKGAMRFQWSGAAAEGTAYADSLSFLPTGLSVTLKDNRGKWGEQKIIDFSVSPPAVVGTYKSPASQQWPPPTNGVYMPREARLFDSELAFTTWMTDGLRVLDVNNPAAPKEVASFLPPGVADPSAASGAGVNNAPGGGFLFRGFSWPTQRLLNGVAVRKLGANSARVVVTDINGGLFVVDAAIRRPSVAPPPPPPPPPAQPPAAPPPPPPPGTSADTVKPLLSALSIRPASFKALARGASVVRSGGGLLRYRLSEDARVTFTVERVEKGRRRGATCQRPSAANRSGRACTRYVRVGSFTHSGKSGSNSLRFSGRVSGRKLSPNRYRLRVVAKDSAGNSSTAKTVNLRIVR